jgi:DNA-binding NarL/FixJ family response regulator
VLSSARDSETVTAAMRAGATSYLLKIISNEKLASTIRSTRAGEHILSAEVTERELEVLRLLAEGKNNIEIAQMISLSRSTVKYHVSAIISKMGVTNRSEAIAIALKNHVV